MRREAELAGLMLPTSHRALGLAHRVNLKPSQEFFRPISVPCLDQVNVPVNGCTREGPVVVIPTKGPPKISQKFT